MARITIELDDRWTHEDIRKVLTLSLVRMSNRLVVEAIPEKGEPIEERVWKDRFNGPSA